MIKDLRQRQFPKYKDQLQDGRRKIPTSEHEEIRKLYKEIKSQREIAKLYNVTRRAIVYILFPERLIAFQKMRRAKRPWLKYYDKEKTRIAVQKYREKKRRLGFKDVVIGYKELSTPNATQPNQNVV